MHAQDDHAGRPIELLRSRRDLDAAQFRHADVEDDDVGLVLLAQPHGLQPVAGFGDDRAGRLTSSSPRNPRRTIL